MKIALIFDNALSFNTYVTTGVRLTDGSVTEIRFIRCYSLHQFVLETGDEIMIPTDKYVVVTNKR